MAKPPTEPDCQVRVAALGADSIAAINAGLSASDRVPLPCLESKGRPGRCLYCERPMRATTDWTVAFAAFSELAATMDPVERERKGRVVAAVACIMFDEVAIAALEAFNKLKR